MFLLSGTPGTGVEHIYNILLEIVLMIIEFMILLMGYDFVIGLYNDDEFIKSNRWTMYFFRSIGLIATIPSIYFFQNAFFNPLFSFINTHKHNLSLIKFNVELATFKNTFFLTLATLLIALSLSYWLSALAQVVTNIMKES